MMGSIKHIKSPEVVPFTEKFSTFNVFLAGSIEQGVAIDWQDEFFKGMEKHHYSVDVNVYNPRRENWDSSWSQSTENEELVKQIEWELEYLENADLIVMFLQPGTISPISLLELGLFKDKVIVVCPDGFHRKTNVVVTCRRYGIEMLDSLEQLLERTKRVIDEATTG